MIKLKDILKEGTASGDKSLAYFQHIGYDIFDSIQKLDKEMKQHSVAKKDGKIKKIIKGLYKLESDLGQAINDLDVPDYNRGYDKKRFKRRTEAMSRRIGGKKINIPQVSDFNGDMEKYMDALNKHMKEVEKLAKKQKKNKKNEGKITEGTDFVVSVHYQNDAPIQKGTFTRKEDAKLYIKDMIKKHKLSRGKGFWYNIKNAVEMTTNF